jgi:membrane protein DedA with SNARE-associated domain
MTDPALQNNILEMIRNMGDPGVFLGMFLESSCVPIPSEVIIIGAGAIGIPLLSITIFGSLGATLGGMFGYFLGRYGAKPFLHKYGRFILIRPHHIEKAENFAKKYGVLSVLIGRLIPVVPFKVFSITAGITKINFPGVVIFTFIGVIPRIILLSLFGEALVKYTKPAVVVLGVAILAFIAYKIISKKLK